MAERSLTFLHSIFVWVWAHTKPLSELAITVSVLAAAASAVVAIGTYRRNSTIGRAQWLSTLYSKFYESADLKAIREMLDDDETNSTRIQKLVDQQASGFTDYLNFFEFMAYLEHCGQLSSSDIAAMFDYYLRILNKHEGVRKYIHDDRNGYGYLKQLSSKFS